MRVPIGLSYALGVNRFNAPHDIDDQEAVTLKNLYPPESGQLATRPVTAFASGFTTSGGYPLACQFLPVNAPADFAAIVRKMGATAVNTLFNAYVRTAGFGAPVATADFGVPTPYGAAMIAYLGKVYAFGGYGSNANGKVLQRTLGGGVEIVDFAFSTAGNTALRPHLVGNYRERFVYMNFGPDWESAFLLADPFEPAVITADALAAKGSYGLVNPDDGDRITAGVEVTQTGATDAVSSFLILKEWSGFMLTGEPPFSDGTGPDNLQVLKLPVNCGCASQATVCRTPFGLIWAGPDDVWVFPEGQLPYRIGTKIRPVLQASPANVRYRWHAAFDQGFYKLALFSAGQGPDDDSPCGEQWWLDMRQGLPAASPEAWRSARWYGPQVFINAAWDATPFSEEGSRAMALDVKPGSDRSLYSASATDTGAALWSHGASGSHDAVNPGAEPYFDTAVIPEILTKEFKNVVKGNQLVADGVMEKGLHGVEALLYVSKSGLVAWKWILNNGKTVGAETTFALGLPSGFLLGTSLLGTDSLSTEEGQMVLDPSPTRVVGNTLQLKIYGKAGYYIDSTNDLIVMDYEMSPGVTVRLRASLTQGYYATMDALCTHIAAQLSAQLIAPMAVTFSRSSEYIVFTNSTGNELALGTGHVALADHDKVQTLAMMLGYNNWSLDYEGGVSVTATERVYDVTVPMWRFPSGMVLHLYTIPRRLL